MNKELEVVWDGTQRHPITGSRGGLTTYPTREFGGRDLPEIEAEAWRSYQARQRAVGVANAAVILAAVAAGAQTAPAVMAATGFEKRCVNRHLLRLLETGQVRRTKGELITPPTTEDGCLCTC